MIGLILKKILLGMVTEKVLKKLIVVLLEQLAKKTDNTVDDEVVKIVKEALG